VIRCDSCFRFGQTLMSTPAEADCRLMHDLQACPELLELVKNSTGTELQIQSRLRKQFPDQLVRMAVGLVELRRKARSKFSQAERMWFDRQGLEQSTAEPVAVHKAKRFHGHVFDLCCGIGGDALALAEHCEVTAVDQNPTACLRAAWNCEVYDRTNVRTLSADVLTMGVENDLVHLDPDRRAGGKGRVVRIEDYVPGLPFMQSLVDTHRGGAIKLSPATNFGGKFPEAEVELISLDGECKEATIWYGELHSGAPWRATVLPSGQTLAGHPLDFLTMIAPLQRYIYDPDPAVVRSGLVDMAASQLGLERLDDREEYLTGDHLVESPFVRGFEVLAEMPNNPHDLQKYLRTSDVGQVEIKCRQIPVDAEALRRKLPLTGTQALVVLFARVQGKARILVGRRIEMPTVA